MGNIETEIKNQVKEYLAIKGIYSYPLTQGLGSQRGLPDRVMHRNGHVEYLEIKTPKGVMSIYQIMFKEQCEFDGIPYHVIRSLDDLMEILDN